MNDTFREYPAIAEVVDGLIRFAFHGEPLPTEPIPLTMTQRTVLQAIVESKLTGIPPHNEYGPVPDHAHLKRLLQAAEA